MARTHTVKSYRGQRKCQWEEGEGWSATKCGEPLNAHYDRAVTLPDGRPAIKLTMSETATIASHSFTQTPLRCESCGEPINIGDPYKWVAPRAHRAQTGHKKVRHRSCPGWKQSELTSSQHLATIYGGQEGAEAALASLHEPTDQGEADAYAQSLTEIAQEAADEIEGAAESYRESAEAIEEGFGHPTYQSEELAEKAYDVESWCEEIRSVDIEEFAEEEICAECGMAEDDDDHQDEEEENYHDWDPDPEPLESWAAEQIEQVYDILQSSPL